MDTLKNLFGGAPAAGSMDSSTDNSSMDMNTSPAEPSAPVEQPASEPAVQACPDCGQDNCVCEPEAAEQPMAGAPAQEMPMEEPAAEEAPQEPVTE